MSRHDFVDPISGRTMVLDMGNADSRPYDGTHGALGPERNVP